MNQKHPQLQTSIRPSILQGYRLDDWWVHPRFIMDSYVLCVSHLDLTQVQMCQHHRQLQTIPIRFLSSPLQFSHYAEAKYLVFQIPGNKPNFALQDLFWRITLPSAWGSHAQAWGRSSPRFAVCRFFLFPLTLRLRFVTAWTDASMPVSLSSSSSLLISKSFLFAFFCLHKRWPQIFLLLLFPTAIPPAKPAVLSPSPSIPSGIKAEPLKTSMRSQPSQNPAGNLHFRDSHSHWVLTPGRQGAPRLGKCLPLPHDTFLSCWKGHFPHHVYSPSRDIWTGWNFPHGVTHQLSGQSNPHLLMDYAALLSNKNLCCNFAIRHKLHC